MLLFPLPQENRANPLHRPRTAKISGLASSLSGRTWLGPLPYQRLTPGSLSSTMRAWIKPGTVTISKRTTHWKSIPKLWTRGRSSFNKVGQIKIKKMRHIYLFPRPTRRHSLGRSPVRGGRPTESRRLGGLVPPRNNSGQERARHFRNSRAQTVPETWTQRLRGHDVAGCLPHQWILPGPGLCRTARWEI